MADELGGCYMEYKEECGEPYKKQCGGTYEFEEEMQRKKLESEECPVLDCPEYEEVSYDEEGFCPQEVCPFDPVEPECHEFPKGECKIAIDLTKVLCQVLDPPRAMTTAQMGITEISQQAQESMKNLEQDVEDMMGDIQSGNIGDKNFWEDEKI
jgi:hypothetical protein